MQDLQASFGASTNFNSTSRVHTLDVVITWNEPTTLNGVITFYEVNVTQTDDSSIAVYSNDRLNVLSITESVMVLPFTNYTVTVAASTSAGQGEGTSITIKSPEAGRAVLVIIIPFFYAFPQLQAKWKILELCSSVTVQRLMTALECTLWI